MHTNTNAWEKADRTIFLGFLWGNASYRSAKFKMCFCKVILWLYAEVCGRRQHFCCPMGCPLMPLTCGRGAVPSSCGGTWIGGSWGSYALGSDIETHWDSSAVSLGEGRVNLAQCLLSLFLFREDSCLDPKWRKCFLADLIQTLAWQGTTGFRLFFVQSFLQTS